MRQLTAHYFQYRKEGQVIRYLIISETLQPIGDTYMVEGKAHAKQIAKRMNAKPWNF